MSNRIQEYFQYLPVRPRDRDWGLYVTGAGYQPILPGSHYPPNAQPAAHTFVWQRGRVMDQYGVVYLVHGQGEFQSTWTDLRKVAVGDAIVVFPGVWHRFRPLCSVGWQVYWVHFQGEDAQRLQNRGFLRPEEPVLRVGLNEIVLDPFVRLVDRLRTEPAGFQHMIAADTLQIISAMLGGSCCRSASDPIHQAKALLEQTTSGVPLMEDIARRLDMSRAHFFRVFKEQTGLTPYQYHLKLKVNRARQMLRHSNASIKQIARALGFRDVYHFSQFFKKQTGIAPTPWRRSQPFEVNEETFQNSPLPPEKAPG